MSLQPVDHISSDDGGRRFDWTAPLVRLGPLIGLFFVFGLFALLVHVVPGGLRFATLGNMELMLRQTAVVGVAALGMTMVIISGGIDLSVASNISFSTVVIARVMFAYDGLAPNLAAICGTAAAATFGLLIGVLVSGARLSPFIVTLGTWGAYRGLAEGLAGNTRAYPVPIDDRHLDPDRWRVTWFAGLLDELPKSRRWMLLPPGVWAMILLALLVAAILRYTRFGRHIFAIGSNEQTARL